MIFRSLSRGARVSMSDIYISEDCISCPKCLNTFGTIYFPRKPYIVNCENSCVLCEKSLERRIRSQVKIEGIGVKIKVEEGCSMCHCGPDFKNSKSRPDYGLERKINDFKCKG